MNIQQAQLIAHQQFINEYHDAPAIDLIKRYARTEVVASVGKIGSFAAKFEKKIKSKKIRPGEFSSFCTWFYINYVTGNTNGRLKTETAINAAFIHFLENKNSQVPLRIYEFYAQDELKMDEIAASEYASKINFEVVEDEEDTGEFNRFYIWYYITYLANKASS